MKKLIVTVYGIALLGFCHLGLTNYLYYAPTLINLSKPYMIMRTVLILVFVTYAFIPWIRSYMIKTLLNLGGFLLLSLGIFTILSPGLLGHLNNWVLLGDSITLLEVGILAIVLSAELPARRTRNMIRIFYYGRLLFISNPKELIYSLLVVAKSFRFVGLARKELLKNRTASIYKELMGTFNIPNKVPP